MHTNRTAESLLARAGMTLNGPHPYDPRINDPRTFRRVFFWGSLGLGDSYVDGQWDCDQLDEFFNKALRSRLEYDIGLGADRLLALRDSIMNLQSVKRALQVAEHHYDLGNDLYEHMLGESMGYSSGYYETGKEDLTEAQYAKFDRVCRELGLKRGMKVLEIGCGWGTFARHAAQKYGVEVLAVTVSKEQLAFAKNRCNGLPVEFFFGDYRTLPKEREGTFDRVVSIEMIEAVGTRNLRAYMHVAHRMLKDDGHFLVQVILGNGVPDVWLSTRIFPNGVLPSIQQLAASIEGLFRILDVKNFGHDYDRTLMGWDQRFRENWPNIKELRGADGKPLYDERFYRMWRYYLLVCAGAFRAKKIDVAQIVFAKPAIS